MQNVCKAELRTPITPELKILGNDKSTMTESVSKEQPTRKELKNSGDRATRVTARASP